jgi:bacteriophage N4 adsorption protein B
MAAAIRRALLIAGLAWAFAVNAASGIVPPRVPAAQAPASVATMSPEEIDRAVRAITEQPSVVEPAGLYLRMLIGATLLLTVLIFVSGIDDAFVDACYWLGRLRRRKRYVGNQAELAQLLARPEAAFAIMVPAWKEHEVIAAMIENNVGRLQYDAYRIYCGVYPNDAQTRAEVDRMVERYPGRVVRVDVAHDGPTCKGDCLNHIVQRVLQDEKSTGTRIAGLVLHDSEDVIHPLELKIFNALVSANDLIQLPVFSLPRKWTDFAAGTYMDDFAESHGKDMAVREALIGIVPGAGVATCYSRRCLAALWAVSAGEPFNTASLTEDYDLSFRLKALRMRETFAYVTVDSEEFRAPGVPGCTGSVVSTHEYFPDRIKTAYRQRARWIIGIAFQGWQHMRWRGSLAERYFLFRDRKGLVMAPAAAAAYVLLANFAFIFAFGSYELNNAVQSTLSSPALASVLMLNLAFMANRALQRAYFVGCCYGTAQGLLALLRMPVNNLINFLAVMRAWRLFLAHLATGKKLAWDKTAHVYPDAGRLSSVTTAPSRVSAAAAKALVIVAASCALALVTVPAALAQPAELTGRAYQLADQAYKALEAEDLPRALQLVRQALRAAPGHPSLLLLEADVLSRQDKPAEAVERIRALSARELGGWGLAQRGYISLKAGDKRAAEADFIQALGLEGVSPESRANISGELAYLALERNDDVAALKWFNAALASPAPGMSSANLAADAGYAAMRIGDNSAAVEYLSRAIEDGAKAPADKRPFDEQTIFDMRRSVDTLSRRWSGIFSIGHSTLGGAFTAPGVPGRDLRVLQAGAEIIYTPERFGYRDGRLFQLYANGFQGLSANDEDYTTGAQSRVLGVGARYKPFRDYYVLFGLERRITNSAAEPDDWIARIAYSASRQTDWNPVRDSWTTWQVYTETAYFIEGDRLIQPFDARVGRSWKVARWHGAVATPFVGIAGEYDKAQDPRMAAGIGPGIALRYWFGETVQRAFARRIDFSMQYRYRLTDAKRGGGLFALLSLSF